MTLKHLSLQNFRSYPKASFTFDPHLTIVVGPNASGKSNLVEAIGMLSLGKSFRTSKEKQLIGLGEMFARITGEVSEVGENDTKLEILLAEMSGQSFTK